MSGANNLSHYSHGHYQNHIDTLRKYNNQFSNNKNPRGLRETIESLRAKIYEMTNKISLLENEIDTSGHILIDDDGYPEVMRKATSKSLDITMITALISAIIAAIMTYNLEDNPIPKSSATLAALTAIAVGGTICQIIASIGKPQTEIVSLGNNAYELRSSLSCLEKELDALKSYQTTP